MGADAFYEQYAPIHAKGLRALPINATIDDTRKILPYEDASNYTVKVEAETCKACGLCVKRCPMDALQLKFSPKAVNKFNKAAVVSNEACIGCGVCVHKCPTDSLKLIQREAISDPPEDVRDYSMRFMADRRKGEPLLRTSDIG